MKTASIIALGLPFLSAFVSAQNEILSCYDATAVYFDLAKETCVDEPFVSSGIS